MHAHQLLDINLDGGEEVRYIPTLEVQRTGGTAMRNFVPCRGGVAVLRFALRVGYWQPAAGQTGGWGPSCGGVQVLFLRDRGHYRPWRLHGCDVRAQADHMLCL